MESVIEPFSGTSQASARASNTSNSVKHTFLVGELEGQLSPFVMRMNRDVQRWAEELDLPSLNKRWTLLPAKASCPKRFGEYR